MTLVHANFIATGLNEPTYITVSGNRLFVVNAGAGGTGNGSIGLCDATTGAPINANFIIGLTGPEGIAVVGNSFFNKLQF
jgi:hypothetical protein